MADAIVGKIERKYMGHFIDTEFATGTETPSWYRIGEDLEEYNVDLNPDTELVKNILGSTRFDHNGYEPSADADPFYARVGDPLFDKLQSIVDNRYTGDRCKTNTLEVHLWEEGTTSGTYIAWEQPCYLVPTSYGGDTSGYQIPFTVNYVGERKKGTFTPDGNGSGSFVADAL